MKREPLSGVLGNNCEKERNDIADANELYSGWRMVSFIARYVAELERPEVSQVIRGLTDDLLG